MKDAGSQSVSKIYRWPTVLALTIASGLAAALTGQRMARMFSWLALATPLVVIAVSLVLARLKRTGQMELFEEGEDERDRIGAARKLK